MWPRQVQTAHSTVIVLAIAAGLALSAWLAFRFLLAEEEDSGFLRWRDPAEIAAGEQLYRASCAGCHGIPGLSKPVAQPGQRIVPSSHDEEGHTWQHPDFALFRLVRDGEAVANCDPVDAELMPRFRGAVSDSQLVAILSYIKSTWPEEIRAHHDRVNRMYAPYNAATRALLDRE